MGKAKWATSKLLLPNKKDIKEFRNYFKFASKEVLNHENVFTEYISLTSSQSQSQLQLQSSSTTSTTTTNQSTNINEKEEFSPNFYLDYNPEKSDKQELLLRFDVNSCYDQKGITPPFRKPYDICFALDISESMSKQFPGYGFTSLEMCLRQIFFTIKKLTPMDRVALVLFYSEEKEMYPLTYCTEANKHQLTQLLSSIVCKKSTWTCLGRGLAAALNILANGDNTLNNSNNNSNNNTHNNKQSSLPTSDNLNQKRCKRVVYLSNFYFYNTCDIRANEIQLLTLISNAVYGHVTPILSVPSFQRFILGSRGVRQGVIESVSKKSVYNPDNSMYVSVVSVGRGMLSTNCRQEISRLIGAKYYSFHNELILENLLSHEMIPIATNIRLKFPSEVTIQQIYGSSELSTYSFHSRERSNSSLHNEGNDKENIKDNEVIISSEFPSPIPNIIVFSLRRTDIENKKNDVSENTIYNDNNCNDNNNNNNQNNQNTNNNQINQLPTSIIPTTSGISILSPSAPITTIDLVNSSEIVSTQSTLTSTSKIKCHPRDKDEYDNLNGNNLRNSNNNNNDHNNNNNNDNDYKESKRARIDQVENFCKLNEFLNKSQDFYTSYQSDNLNKSKTYQLKDETNHEIIVPIIIEWDNSTCNKQSQKFLLTPLSDNLKNQKLSSISLSLSRENVDIDDTTSPSSTSSNIDPEVDLIINTDNTDNNNNNNDHNNNIDENIQSSRIQSTSLRTSPLLLPTSTTNSIQQQLIAPPSSSSSSSSEINDVLSITSMNPVEEAHLLLEYVNCIQYYVQCVSTELMNKLLNNDFSDTETYIPDNVILNIRQFKKNGMLYNLPSLHHTGLMPTQQGLCLSDSLLFYHLIIMKLIKCQKSFMDILPIDQPSFLSSIPIESIPNPIQINNNLTVINNSTTSLQHISSTSTPTLSLSSSPPQSLSPSLITPIVNLSNSPILNSSTTSTTSTLPSISSSVITNTSTATNIMGPPSLLTISSQIPSSYRYLFDTLHKIITVEKSEYEKCISHLMTSNERKKFEELCPKQYFCPISLSIMKNPVIAYDGYSYEEENILKWFRTGNITSPVTNIIMSSSTVIPNHTLKSLIDEFLDKFYQSYFIDDAESK